MGTQEGAGQMGPQRWSVHSSQGLPFCRSCPQSIVVKDIAARDKIAIWNFAFYEHAKSINVDGFSKTRSQNYHDTMNYMEQ